MDSILLDSTKRDIPRHTSDELSKVDFEIPNQNVFALLLAHPVKYSSGRAWPVYISGGIMLGQSLDNTLWRALPNCFHFSAWTQRFLYKILHSRRALSFFHPFIAVNEPCWNASRL